MRLPLRLPFVTLLITALLAPMVASADPTSDSQFVSDTNQARADHGLRSYRVASDLTSEARRWAAYMASHRTLEHNPDYTSQTCCWSELGENVGEGSSVSQIQNAFMNSAPHRDNILSSSFTQVGIGTARGSDGQLYVDEVFRRPQGAVTTTSAPTRTVTRSTPARASRSAQRAPRAAVRRPARAAARPSATAMLISRLAAARRAWRATPAPDPVSGVLAYVRFVETLTGSAG